MNPEAVSQANSASATLRAKVSGSSDAATVGSRGVAVGAGSLGMVTTGPGSVPPSLPGSLVGGPVIRPETPTPVSRRTATAAASTATTRCRERGSERSGVFMPGRCAMSTRDRADAQLRSEGAQVSPRWDRFDVVASVAGGAQFLSEPARALSGRKEGVDLLVGECGGELRSEERRVGEAGRSDVKTEYV